MNNPRMYGRPPYKIVVVHGGPGAAGDVAPLAHELANHWGVLEPIQTQLTIDGLVEELRNILLENTDSPVSLIGHSWGAWLSVILTANYPELVGKLILISSGPFDKKYAEDITKTRVERLNDQEQIELLTLMNQLNEEEKNDKDNTMKKFVKLLMKADNYKSIQNENEIIDFNYRIFIEVWPVANMLRNNGELLKLTEKIKCPVTAIHGDYDPHPYRGVKEPLSKTIKDFKFILLGKCGHYPWLEREARADFFRVLNDEI